DRDFVIGAYDGSRLIGCFFAARASFRVDSREIIGTIGSWLTIDPSARSPRLGLEIVEELRRRHTDRRMAFLLGFVNGDASTPANMFWTSYARLYPEHIRFVRRIGYWIRILNGESLRRKCLHWFERVAARAHQLPLLRPSRGVTCEIRGYAPTDL